MEAPQPNLRQKKAFIRKIRKRNAQKHGLRMDFPRHHTGLPSLATHEMVKVERRIQCEKIVSDRTSRKEHRCANKSMPGRTACGVHGGGARLAGGSHKRQPLSPDKQEFWMAVFNRGVDEAARQA
jgi:hypothetical protein